MTLEVLTLFVTIATFLVALRIALKGSSPRK